MDTTDTKYGSEGIDTPTYPLEKQHLGKTKGSLMRGFAGGLLAILWFAALNFWLFFKVSMKEESRKQKSEIREWLLAGHQNLR
ncbi:hypothetical protein [Paludibacter sp.]|uniref:hypothetical protein n=1 Tax=Paludibacter sp. TaxID=1898105 RepID=UPI0013525754|nr:hypothetical protein [Paludibacter sp.]MTK52790.1 hypothetical protein [Paludibacter sp.]